MIKFIEQKPVFWCPNCVTALAEAEVEYELHKSPSIYVKFPLTEETKNFLKNTLNIKLPKSISILIWTTTPWTLPANLALAFNPEFDYLLVKWDEELFIVAEGRISALCAELNRDLPKIVAKINPKDLEGKKLIIPFMKKKV